MSEAARKISVLIVDDQRVVRDGLALIVGTLDGVEVVGCACEGAEAVDMAAWQHPDVVLMDLDMPVLDGAAATELLRDRSPGSAVLILTTYTDDAHVLPALRAGARGYLTKDADAERIGTAIREVHAGRTYLDPVVQARLVAAVAAGPAGAAAGPVQSAARPLPDGLTSREAQVLGLIAQGLSNTEICDRLFVSRATVKSHVNRIFAKTGARDRAQAVRYAYRVGLAD